MTPETLRIVGTACFGRSWQKQLSEAIGVNPRTMRRYMARELQVPDDIRGELHAIILDRMEELELALKALKAV